MYIIIIISPRGLSGRKTRRNLNQELCEAEGRGGVAQWLERWTRD